MSDDLSHDTHLRAALRHAPDHALSPPAGVSQTILNAARQVHRPARPAATPAPAVRITVAPPRAIAWLRQWFASPRLAGGLATGLVAALGLGLWIDLGREPVIERAPERSVDEMRRGADSAPITSVTKETSDARPSTAPPPVPDTARRKTLERSAELAKAGRQMEGALHQAPPTPPEPAPARREEPAREAEALAKASPPPPATAPAPAAAPARADDAVAAAEPAPAVAAAPKSVAPAASAEQTALAQQRDAASRSDMRMSLAAGRAAAAAAPAGARASAAEVGAAVDAVSAASPAFALLRRARGELTSASARWSWTPPASPLMAPFDDAGQSWLTRVVQASRGRWTDVTERAGTGDVIEVRWWRDDWPQATLRIEADGLRWIEHGGRIRYAPLDAATLQRLRSL